MGRFPLLRNCREYFWICWYITLLNSSPYISVIVCICIFFISFHLSSTDVIIIFLTYFLLLSYSPYFYSCFHYMISIRFWIISWMFTRFNIHTHWFSSISGLCALSNGSSSLVVDFSIIGMTTCVVRWGCGEKPLTPLWLIGYASVLWVRGFSPHTHRTTRRPIEELEREREKSEMEIKR